ncbi:MAG TPA: YqgE/AlgH family protein, partial [Alteromonas sp.]|nr:YqgE/AlgH family protein [Alteromonas sp.]
MKNLANHFLIAMPSMEDPFFSRSLTYICEHNEEGAMGLVVNQPTNMTLKELLEQADKDAEVDDEKGQQIV